MDKAMMTTNEKKIIPELFDIARNLPEEKQKFLVTLGKSLLFMMSVENDVIK